MKNFHSPDVTELTELTDPYRHDMLGFEPTEWLSKEDNIAIVDDRGNLSLFEKGSDGVYSGHYFFKDRGKEALKAAREMLKYIFSETDIALIRGMTPLEKLGARWMSRQLGFKGVGVIDPFDRPCELFVLSKADWERSQVNE